MLASPPTTGLASLQGHGYSLFRPSPQPGLDFAPQAGEPGQPRAFASAKPRQAHGINLLEGKIPSHQGINEHRRPLTTPGSIQ